MDGRKPLLPPLDDEPGPSPARSREQLSALKQRIVARAASRAVGWRAWSWRPVQLAAAAALLLALTGSGYAAVRRWPELAAALGVGAEQAVASTRTAPAPDRARYAEPEPESEPEPEPESESEPEPDPASTPAPGSASNALPIDWLARANRLRAAQRWRAAEAAYIKVLEHGASPGARAAAALAAADLRLQQLAKPRAALPLFERVLALAPSGALAEQARHGIAESQRALGDGSREADAWRTFLRAHPGSRMRAHAEARLHALRP